MRKLKNGKEQERKKYAYTLREIIMWVFYYLNFSVTKKELWKRKKKERSVNVVRVRVRKINTHTSLSLKTKFLLICEFSHTHTHTLESPTIIQGVTRKVKKLRKIERFQKRNALYLNIPKYYKVWQFLRFFGGKSEYNHQNTKPSTY